MGISGVWDMTEKLFKFLSIEKDIAISSSQNIPSHFKYTYPSFLLLYEVDL